MEEMIKFHSDEELLETNVIKEIIIDPLIMIKSKEKWILKYAILDEPNTMIIMGFNKGIISLYDISHLRFDGDILEVDNVFSRMYFMFMWYYWCWLYFMSSDTGTKSLLIIKF